MNWHENLIEDDENIRQILHSTKKIAVIGIKDEDHSYEAAQTVPKYLMKNGYTIFPVNPKVKSVFGLKCYDAVTDLPEPVDTVLVFRAPDNVPRHAEEVLAMAKKPQVFWMQTGIRNMGAAHRLAEAGIKVVQDHCMYLDHLRLVREH